MCPLCGGAQNKSPRWCVSITSVECGSHLGGVWQSPRWSVAVTSWCVAVTSVECGSHLGGVCHGRLLHWGPMWGLSRLLGIQKGCPGTHWVHQQRRWTATTQHPAPALSPSSPVHTALKLKSAYCPCSAQRLRVPQA